MSENNLFTSDDATLDPSLDGNADFFPVMAEGDEEQSFDAELFNSQLSPENLGVQIKRQILTHRIKNPCCIRSFITGTEVFAKKRKNEFTEQVNEYKEMLLSHKKRAYFDEQIDVGYLPQEESGDIFPHSKGRICPACAQNLVKGAFMVCGRANISDKDMHLEMSMNCKKSADVMLEILNEQIPFSRSTRRSETIIYIKSHDKISDFAAYIGAVTIYFGLLNYSIVRTFRLKANRQKNCDTKNIERSLSASEAQLFAIKALKAADGLASLPISLRETARLRLENPIASLEEISEMHTEKISRSGVNHRLRRIVEIAEKKGYIIK